MIDTGKLSRHHGTVAANSATGFDRLTKRQTSRLISRSGGIFTFAHRATGTPFYGGQWRGGFTPADSLCRSVNPAICPPPQSFDSGSGAFKTKERGTTMAIIRKGYNSPVIAHPLRTFPTIIQAAAFVDRLTADNTAFYRFSITQNGQRWTVSRVSGGAA